MSYAQEIVVRNRAIKKAIEARYGRGNVFVKADRGYRNGMGG